MVTYVGTCWLVRGRDYTYRSMLVGYGARLYAQEHVGWSGDMVTYLGTCLLVRGMVIHPRLTKMFLQI